MKNDGIVESLAQSRRCSKCERLLPLTEFAVKRSSHTKLAARCNRCRSKPAVTWNLRYPERVKAAQRRFIESGNARLGRLRRQYGLDAADFASWARRQGDVCAICREPGSSTRGARLHVDHDHSTGLVRGLLCTNCNRGLGYFKDSVERLIDAAEYLERFAARSGDQALFGGVTTRQMKDRLGVPDARPLADFLPTVTIKAKDFANEITIHNTTERDLRSESEIAAEHVESNTEVRRALERRGIRPESLPAAEDVKKVERRLRSEERKLPGGTRRKKGGAGSDES